MAHELLTLPVSIMASETVFSASNRKMDERRSSLTMKKLEWQVCLKEWDDADHRIQYEITKECCILEILKTMDLLDDEENEDNY